MQPNTDNNLDVTKQNQETNIKENGFFKKRLLSISSAITLGVGVLSVPVQS